MSREVPDQPWEPEAGGHQLPAPGGEVTAEDALGPGGRVLVVEGDTGRLFRVDSGGGRRLEASGLATRTVGLGLPLLNFSADVLVRRDGTIVVSGAADGSLVELTPR